MTNGKKLCEILRRVRTAIAEQYGLRYNPIECKFKGNCKGTCPRCDAELEDLQRQLETKGISNVAFSESISNEIKKFTLEQTNKRESKKKIFVTEGMPSNPMYIMGEIDRDVFELPIDKINKQTLYKKCTVAGINFHNIEEIWDELRIGTELTLIRDHHNKYDKNAIAVAFKNNFIIGYIPRKENEEIARLMDLELSIIFQAEICELYEHRPYNDRIHILIYISNQE